MKIRAFLLMGLLLLSMSQFSARQDNGLEVQKNLQYIPGMYAQVDEAGNVKIELGTYMPGMEITLVDAFGIQNHNEFAVVIAGWRVTGDPRAGIITILPSERIVLASGETLWLTVSIKLTNETTWCSWNIQPVIG